MRAEFISTVWVVADTKDQAEAYLYGWSKLVECLDFQDGHGRAHVLARFEVQASTADECTYRTTNQVDRYASGLLGCRVVTDDEEREGLIQLAGAELYGSLL